MVSKHRDPIQKPLPDPIEYGQMAYILYGSAAADTLRRLRNKSGLRLYAFYEAARREVREFTEPKELPQGRSME